jgi:hypothetical protein
MHTQPARGRQRHMLHGQIAGAKGEIGRVMASGSFHRSTLAGDSRLEYVLPSLSCNIGPYAAGGRRRVRESAKSQLHRKMMRPCPVSIPLVAAFSFRCQCRLDTVGDADWWRFEVLFQSVTQPDNMLIKTRGPSLN